MASVFDGDVYDDESWGGELQVVRGSDVSSGVVGLQIHVVASNRPAVYTGTHRCFPFCWKQVGSPVAGVLFRLPCL